MAQPKKVTKIPKSKEELAALVAAQAIAAATNPAVRKQALATVAAVVPTDKVVEKAKQWRTQTRDAQPGPGLTEQVQAQTLLVEQHLAAMAQDQSDEATQQQIAAWTKDVARLRRNAEFAEATAGKDRQKRSKEVLRQSNALLGSVMAFGEPQPARRRHLPSLSAHQRKVTEASSDALEPSPDQTELS